MKIILQTIHDELSVKEACELLGIGPTQFANLRLQTLQGMVDSIQPKPAGRRTRAHVATAQEVAMKQQIADLERENSLLRTQLEVVAIRAEGRRSKSDGPAAQRSALPRTDAAGGAVP